MSTPEVWGYMLNKCHDQLKVGHLLKPDNSPACGARYYASAGASDVPENQRCRSCLRVLARARAREQRGPNKPPDAVINAIKANASILEGT